MPRFFRQNEDVLAELTVAAVTMVALTTCSDSKSNSLHQLCRHLPSLDRHWNELHQARRLICSAIKADVAQFEPLSRVRSIASQLVGQAREAMSVRARVVATDACPPWPTRREHSIGEQTRQRLGDVSVDVKRFLA